MAIIGGFLNINEAVSGRDELTVGKSGVTAAGSTDAPLVTLSNPDAENTDGGRESKLLFTGNKADETAHQLGLIQVSHDGSSDDKKGKIQLYVNDGADSDDSLTEAFKISTKAAGIPRIDIGSGIDNTEMHIGNSQKAYIGVGTQADYSGNFNDKAVIAINTVVLKGTGGNTLDVLNSTGSARGNIMGNRIQALGHFRLSGTGCYIAGNSDTDIDFQKADETTVMRLETDNVRLGIGITSPVATLHAVGANAAKFSHTADCEVTIEGGEGEDAILTLRSDEGDNSADITKFKQVEGEGLHIQTTNSTINAMTILSDGKIGVGETSPDTLLHMTGADPYATFTNTAGEDSSGGRESKLIFEGTTVAGGTTYDATQHHLAEIVASHDGSANDKKGQIQFKGNDGDDANGSLQTNLTIDSDGDIIVRSNVYAGIGNKNSVHIGFNEVTANTVGLFGKQSISGSDNNLWIAPRNINSSNGSYIMLGQRDSTDANAKGNISIVAGLEGTNSQQGNIDINSSAHSGRVYIKGDTGFVGIGHNAPDTKLHVEGDEPYLTLANNTSEDTAGGRESKILFEGKQSGNELGHLAEINVSHIGTEDDKRGQFTIKVNDSDDSDGSLQTAVNIDSNKNVVIGGRTSFDGTAYGSVDGPCAALYAEYTGATMGGTSHSAPIKAIQDYNNSATAYPPSGYQRPSLLISNLDDTNNSFSFIQFAGKSDKTAYPVATIAARNLNTAQAHGMLTFATGGASGSSHSSKILELRKSGSDTWMSITNVKDTSGDNDASDGDDARKSIVKFVGVTQDGGATYDAIEHDLANIVVSHHGTANDKKGKFKILLNDGDDADGSLTQVMFIGSDEGHTALGLGAGAALGDSHHDQYNTFIGKNSGVGTNTGDGNTGVGTGTLYYNQKSNFNTAIGYEAAKFLQHSNDNGTTTSNADVDMYNTCIGYSAMATSKQGVDNTIIGANAGYQLKADGNVAIGRSALSAEDYGDNTVAIGNYALNMQNDVTSSSGSNSTTGNVAVGHHAGKFLEEGLDCTFIGSQAGMGANANRLDGHDNTAVGSQAGYSLITTASGNTLMGTKAGYLQTTAKNNVVIGYNAGYFNQTAGSNVFIGTESGKQLRGTTGTNTSIGHKAMQNGHSTYAENTAHSNTVVGASAMGENTDAAFTSLRNCILGAYAGKEMLSSDDCVLAGYNAGVALTTGNENTIIGNYAGAGLTDNAGQTFIGFKSGNALVTGAEKNTLIGHNTGLKLGHADCDNNTTLGYNAMGGGHGTVGNNTANNNVAIGEDALGGSTSNNFTANHNVAIGVQALTNMHGGYNNTAIGSYDQEPAATTALNNTMIGKNAGSNQQTGQYNTYIGSVAGPSDGTLHGSSTWCTGNYNTSVGGGSLKAIRSTAKGNTAIGYNAGTNAGDTNYGTYIGYDTRTTGTLDNCRDGQVKIGAFGGFQGYSNKLTMSDFTTVADNDVASTRALIKLPRYGFLKRITCTVVTASGGTGEYNISLGSGAVVAGSALSDRKELIGKDVQAAELVGANLRQSTLTNSSTDTAVDIITAKYVHIWEADQSVNDSAGWTLLEGQDMFVHVCHANGSNANDGTNAVLRITIEYFGED